jgi:hypothetical protein
MTVHIELLISYQLYEKHQQYFKIPGSISFGSKFHPVYAEYFMGKIIFIHTFSCEIKKIICSPNSL